MATRRLLSLKNIVLFVLLALLSTLTYLYFFSYTPYTRTLPDFVTDTGKSKTPLGGLELGLGGKQQDSNHDVPNVPNVPTTTMGTGTSPVEVGEAVEDLDVTVLKLPADIAKRDAVVQMFKNAWHAYERDCMGCDEYRPISRSGYNLSSQGGIGYTVVDALDTIYLMGLKEEYQRAYKWVKEDLSFDKDGQYITFEITIRVLGGLLSSYALTSDKLFLNQATDLANRILPVFHTPAGLPLPFVNLARPPNNKLDDDWAFGGKVSVAEVATLQLEFRYLSVVSGEWKFWEAVEKVMKTIEKGWKVDGLTPIDIMLRTGEPARSNIQLGTRGDSYYEYLLKQYLQTEQTEEFYYKMYTGAMGGVHSRLVQHTPKHNMTFLAELKPTIDDWIPNPKHEHLTCFMAGSLLLGAISAHAKKPYTPSGSTHWINTGSAAGSGGPKPRVSRPPKVETELTEQGKRDWELGMEVLETCMASHDTKTGLAPEWVHFRMEKDHGFENDWYIDRKGGPSPWDSRYMLRPEILESVFIAWRLTGDQKYRDFAWNVYQSIEAYARVPPRKGAMEKEGPTENDNGYATVLDVDQIPVRLEDKQETFFLSETLKYLFLTFSDSDVVPLDQYVLNTEAHPLPMFMVPKSRI